MCLFRTAWRAALAALLPLAVFALPTVARAQPEEPNTRYVQCAISYAAGPETIVMTFATYEAQTLILEAGAACSTWIEGGEWEGADMYVEWDEELDPTCRIELSPARSINVFTGSDVRSRVLGGTHCLRWESDGYQVTLY